MSIEVTALAQNKNTNRAAFDVFFMQLYEAFGRVRYYGGAAHVHFAGSE